MVGMAKKGYLIWDSETANRRQRICSAAFILADKEGRPEGEPVFSLIDPKDDFDPWNTKVNGISEKDVKDAPTFERFYKKNDLKGLLKDRIFVAHNAAGADLYHIKKSLAAADIEMPEVKYLDTMQLSMNAWNVGGLAAACQKAEVPLEDHHDALADARACFGLFTWFKDNGVKMRPEEWSGLAATRSGLRRREPSPDGLGFVNGSDPAVPVESVLHEFEAMGLRADPAEIDSPEGLHFVVSGRVPGYEGDAIEKTLKGLGAKTSSKVSGRTDYLVMGDNVGQNKIDDAKEHLGQVKVMGVQDLLELIERWEA